MSEIIAVTQPINFRCTKNAFQSRFPKAANGVSTKWDMMIQFLNSDSYATAIGITGGAMHDLRLLITTGAERLNASPFVDMREGQQADNMTYLLTQISNSIPFALNSTERNDIMNPPLEEHETYKGVI